MALAAKRIDDVRDVLSIVTCENVNALIWYGAATPAAMASIHALMQQRAALWPQGQTIMHVITDTAGLPDAYARKAFVELLNTWSASIACISTVIERAGFKGSAMRSVVTGVHMLCGTPFPQAVHRSLSEAAIWLVRPHVERTGVKLDPSELRAALQTFHVPKALKVGGTADMLG
jgi:hypothetical protein